VLVRFRSASILLFKKKLSVVNTSRDFEELEELEEKLDELELDELEEDDELELEEEL